MTNTVVSRLSDATKLVAFTDGSVIITGKDANGNKLKQFNMKNKVAMYTEELTNEIDGLAEISLGGRQALAISFR